MPPCSSSHFLSGNLEMPLVCNPVNSIEIYVILSTPLKLKLQEAYVSWVFSASISRLKTLYKKISKCRSHTCLSFLKTFGGPPWEHKFKGEWYVTDDKPFQNSILNFWATAFCQFDISKSFTLGCHWGLVQSTSHVHNHNLPRTLCYPDTLINFVWSGLHNSPLSNNLTHTLPHIWPKF